MIIARRIQSIVVSVLITLSIILLLQTFAGNASFRLISPAVGNSSHALNLTHLQKYIPDRIWWTSETALEPNFAYAQYATDGSYFCNAVSGVASLLCEQFALQM